MKSRDELNDISGKIIDAAIKVHSALGSGMLEGAYEICLIHELVRSGFRIESQVTLPIVYEGIKLDAGYRIDLIVEDEVICELKGDRTPHAGTRVATSFISSCERPPARTSDQL